MQQGVHIVGGLLFIAVDGVALLSAGSGVCHKIGGSIIVHANGQEKKDKPRFMKTLSLDLRRSPSPCPRLACKAGHKRFL
jgi:hypothetical protein